VKFRKPGRKEMASLMVIAVFAALSIAALASIGLVLSKNSHRSAIAYASSVTESIAFDLDSIISQHQLMSITMASILSSDPTRDREKVKKLLFDLFGRSKWIVATYAGYEPNGFDGNDAPWAGKPTHTLSGQFVPFIHTPNQYGMVHEPSKVFVDSLRNIDKYDFYLGPKRTNAPFITPPWTYRDHATGMLQKLVCLTAPIQFPDGSFRGMTGVNIDTGAMLEKFNSMKVFEHGMVFIIYKDGLLLTWPEENLTFTNRIFDVADRFGKANLDKLVADIAAGRKGAIEGRHPMTGAKSWLVYHPVPSCEWGVVVVAPRRDIFDSRNRVLAVLAVFLVLLAGGTLYIIRRML
jgi:methyl-accepting chemotaxis protein